MNVTKNEIKEDLKYCIVRSYRSSPFAGYVSSRNGTEVTILEARRIWYWEGAASLSQLAMSGTSNPSACKFPEPVSSVTVLDAIEILECSEKGKKSIQGVKIWEC